MPAPGTAPPKFNTDGNETQVLRAQPVYERPSWLDGKRTYIGLLISTVGLIGSRFHVDVPTDEMNGVVEIVATQWDVFAQLAGLIVAGWGQFKASKRFQKGVGK